MWRIISQPPTGSLLETSPYIDSLRSYQDYKFATGRLKVLNDAMVWGEWEVQRYEELLSESPPLAGPKVIKSDVQLERDVSKRLDAADEE